MSQGVDKKKINKATDDNTPVTDKKIPYPLGNKVGEEVPGQAANVQDYDPTTLPDHFSMLIYGRRRSGKTFQLRQLVHDIRKRFTEVYLFSDTAELQDKDYAYIPKENRLKGLQEGKLGEIIDKQKEIIQHNKQKKKRDQIKSKIGRAHV